MRLKISKNLCTARTNSPTAIEIPVNRKTIEYFQSFLMDLTATPPTIKRRRCEKKMKTLKLVESSDIQVDVSYSLGSVQYVSYSDIPTFSLEGFLGKGWFLDLYIDNQSYSSFNDIVSETSLTGISVAQVKDHNFKFTFNSSTPIIRFKQRFV